MHARAKFFGLAAGAALAAAIVFPADDATAQVTRPGVRPASPATATGNSGAAQRPTRTTVSVELIVGKEGVGLAAQEWSQTFEQLGLPIRIRSSVLDEKPEVKEKMLGTLRQVTVIGQLDRTGRLAFPEKAFTRADAAKLKEWLDELKTYGAQGAPTGKPLWGLSDTQFSLVYTALANKVTADVDDLSLAEALAKIGVPEKHPLRLTVASQEWLKSEYPELPAVRQRLAGMSLGTALAILLNDYGLGFRPLRTPEGALELAVDPLRVNKEAWPVGWDLKQTRQQTAPRLFELVPVELDEVKLTDVLDAVSEKTGIPVLVDHYRIEGKGIRIDELVVSYAPKKTSWSLLLMGVTNPHKLSRRLQIDELGRPFIWVTVLDPSRKD